MRSAIRQIVWAVAVLLGIAVQAFAAPMVDQFLEAVEPQDLVPGAEAFGIPRDDGLVPTLKGSETIGWVFLTSDFVPTTGYSGKPIHILVGLSPEAHLTGAKLIKHSVLIVTEN